jgi:hypothetical protein
MIRLKPLLETFKRIGGKLPLNEDELDISYGTVYQAGEQSLEDLNNDLDLPANAATKVLYDKFLNNEKLTSKERKSLADFLRTYSDDEEPADDADDWKDTPVYTDLRSARKAGATRRKDTDDATIALNAIQKDEKAFDQMWDDRLLPKNKNIIAPLERFLSGRFKSRINKDVLPSGRLNIYTPEEKKNIADFINRYL